ncbi:hypothetical protein K491DRAFT_716377 [Lophiostoma macrostomum CBS 122681]|uniref:SprT-like domain-containing protein n=1 Tax=Lophiostoma macrostomum CBS 122681 TaxID=1314788 RepID=A0A6A6T5Z9_9PLEO|nr:hypothetical protein K491DRAFT_716377 [Lophiostoma macrostomum CBS 122681]
MDFCWHENPAWMNFGLYQVRPNRPIRIVMNHTLSFDEHFGDRQDTRKLSRLSTLLHEMLHAYLDHYCCENCPTYRENDGRDGHGRAWLMVAAKLEEVFPRLVDLPADLRKFPSLREHMEIYKELPSQCDLERWDMLPEPAELQGLGQKNPKKRKGDDVANEDFRPKKKQKKPARSSIVKLILPSERLAKLKASPGTVSHDSLIGPESQSWGQNLQNLTKRKGDVVANEDARPKKKQKKPAKSLIVKLALPSEQLAKLESSHQTLFHDSSHNTCPNILPGPESRIISTGTDAEVDDSPRKRVRLIGPSVEKAVARTNKPPRKKKERRTTDQTHWLTKKRKPRKAKLFTKTLLSIRKQSSASGWFPPWTSLGK